MLMGRVLIRFRHPRMDLNFLSSVLDLPCSRSWIAGSPKQTPTGEHLSGTYAESYWYSLLEFPNDPTFREKLVLVIDRLVKARRNSP